MLCLLASCSQEIAEFLALAAAKFSGQSGTEVLAATVKLSNLPVAGGADDAKEQGFQFSQVIVADRQIDAEAVPGLCMFVAEMLPQAPAEIVRQANVIELVSPIERVDTVSAADIALDDVLILRQGLSRNILQILADKRFTSTRDV